MKLKRLQKISGEVQKFGALFTEPKLDLHNPTWWIEVDQQGQKVLRLLFRAKEPGLQRLKATYEDLTKAVSQERQKHNQDLSDLSWHREMEILQNLLPLLERVRETEGVMAKEVKCASLR
jgi:hypothetical protein